ncbi:MULTISPECIES: acyl-CoA dehydrogenase family protein [unclassified Streptomyces]|uniref:acyl-CoA dehydrogenase family protein n=1 Tax=unclassified Streptomyces TaxID=2593676 RepID=UPI001D47F099|nr:MULTISPECIES: acyl-CoA dehydrogenase family protein [unclassified Streptomyces]MBD0708861.1 acyl-CoA dehydrogenase [Streptomyces sp. CBMA291]MBD0717005.1 acyl-CoA dehydrogenase [Streptomyces sp. CBMA370]
MTARRSTGARGPQELLTRLAAPHADAWDRAGAIPETVVRSLAEAGVLCPEVPEKWGGLGLDSLAAGLLTAHAGTLCASVRSLMTSQSMVAWALTRWGDPAQRERFLPRLATGATAAVAFSETVAGSDLSAMRTTVTDRGDTVRIDGAKVWTTGGTYADLVLVFGRYGDGTAMVLVPTDAPGLRVERRPDPSGCRAAGHADLTFDGVELDRGHLLPGAGAPLSFTGQSVLAAGRLSVAWGCLGIVQSCLREAVRHARTREQFGQPLFRHQLVARHIGETRAAEQALLRLCEHASRCWNEGVPEMFDAALVAKHVGASAAASAASAAAQVLASAGAHDGHPVARALRDAKLMEIIEGSNEICQLRLAEEAMGVYA